ncbi:MAG: hypothetical protein HYZ91_04580 [Candidatus Omnitrophica bacterium]|nr:hypothetical protein [Candidatus Omnitrophota bacterium]
MGLVVVRLGWPHLLSPWRSPLVRWRLETYGLTDAAGRLLHAEDVTPARFVQFLIRHRRALARFLRWAALL